MVETSHGYSCSIDPALLAMGTAALLALGDDP